MRTRTTNREAKTMFYVNVHVCVCAQRKSLTKGQWILSQFDSGGNSPCLNGQVNHLIMYGPFSFQWPMLPKVGNIIHHWPSRNLELPSGKINQIIDSANEPKNVSKNGTCFGTIIPAAWQQKLGNNEWTIPAGFTRQTQLGNPCSWRVKAIVCPNECKLFGRRY